MDQFWDGFVQTVRRSDFAVSVLILSIVVVVTGPFGTYVEVPVSIRAMYMPFLIVLGAFFMAGLEAVVHRLTSESHVLWRGCMVACAMAVIYSPVVLFVATTATEGLREPRQWPEVFLIVLGLTFFFYCIRHVVVQSVEKPVDQERIAEMLQLDPEMKLYAASADDHYVRVLTDKGEHRVLLRFADALRELEGEDGAQVHRSHWVARPYAKRLVREGQNHRIKLCDGREIPVSRGKLSYAQSLL